VAAADGAQNPAANRLGVEALAVAVLWVRAQALRSPAPGLRVAPAMVDEVEVLAPRSLEATVAASQAEAVALRGIVLAVEMARAGAAAIERRPIARLFLAVAVVMTSGTRGLASGGAAPVLPVAGQKLLAPPLLPAAAGRTARVPLPATARLWAARAPRPEL